MAAECLTDLIFSLFFFACNAFHFLKLLSNFDEMLYGKHMLKEHLLREKILLRIVFGPRVVEVTEGCKQMHLR